MGMSTDVRSAQVTATGEVFAGPARLKGLYFTGGGTAGSVEIKDGGASGTTVLTLSVPANAVVDLHLPENGIRCATSIYAVLTNVTSLTAMFA